MTDLLYPLLGIGGALLFGYLLTRLAHRRRR